MKLNPILLACVLGLPMAGACADSPRAPDGTGVRVDVAAYSLLGAANVCYGVYVQSASGLVAYVPNVCSSQYGNGGGGDISYVIPCDAQDYTDDNVTNAPNTVTLVLEGIEVSDGNTTGWLDETQYQNPCGWPDPSQSGLALDQDGNVSLPLDTDPPYTGPGASAAINWDGFKCQKVIDCVENADALVRFDLTVLRDADQGFFDIAVNFEDIFCSAKVDCKYNDNETIRLVHDPESGARVPTVVFAFACTDGDPPGTTDDNATTHLYLDDIVIDCNGTIASVPVWAGPGNVYDDNATVWYDDNGTLQTDANITLPSQLVQAMVFEGRERITNGGQSADKSYWSVALGLNEAWWASNSATCTLKTRATASKGPLSGGETPELVKYPVIDVAVPLNSGAAMTCSQHPINGTGLNAGVSTTYTDFDAPASFDNEGAPSGGTLITEPVTSSSGGAPTGYVYIEPGTFTMGTSYGHESWGEVPLEVTITRAFWMKQTEVTQAEYSALLGNNTSTFQGPNRPVESLVWVWAKIYANYLSASEGLAACYVCVPPAGSGDPGSCVDAGQGLDCEGYRLPTEAEWEYAARAGSTADLYGVAEDIAWCGTNSNNETHDVGTKQPNAWGLYDMVGNVQEMTSDYFDNSNPMGPVTDPTVWNVDSGASRTKGGSWDDNPATPPDYTQLRVNAGYYLFHSGGDSRTGFRLVRTATP